ncbi:MAG: CoA pyrophosphatase, partial [Tissierellia bacterium]|nr:CoA pyrophosphatase [Tissierellia bacterium]
DNIDIITELDYATSKNGSFIYSFIEHVSNIDISKIKYNKDEVSELFYVPLSFFLENEPQKSYVSYYAQTDEDFPVHMINNGEGYDWGSIRNSVYFYNYKNYIIWGLTAKITYNLIKKIKKI